MKGEALITVRDCNGNIKSQVNEKNKVFDIFRIESEKFLKYIDVEVSDVTNIGGTASLYKPTKMDFRGINLFDVNLDENYGFLSEIPTYWACAETAAPSGSRGQYNGIPEETANSVKRKWTFKIKSNTALKAIALRSYYNNGFYRRGSYVTSHATTFVKINDTQFLNRLGNVYELGYVPNVPLMQTSKRFLKVASLNAGAETAVYLLKDKSKIFIFTKNGTVKIYNNDLTLFKTLLPKVLPSGYHDTIGFCYMTKHPTTGKYYVFYHCKQVAPCKVMLYGLSETFDYDDQDIEFDSPINAISHCLPIPYTQYSPVSIAGEGLYAGNSAYTKIDFTQNALRRYALNEEANTNDNGDYYASYNAMNTYDFYEDNISAFSYDTTNYGSNSTSHARPDFFPDFHVNSRITTRLTNNTFQLSTVLNLTTPLELLENDMLSIEYKITVI